MKIPPHVRWPAMIAGALAIHATAWLTVAWVANSDPSYAVEEDYYRKAVEWDAGRAELAASDALGWRLDYRVEPGPGPAEATVHATLADRDGAPVDGAAVALETFHNARAGDILRADLSADGAGAYSARLPMQRPGVWELRFTADRGADHFRHRETRYLPLEIGR